MSATIAAIRTDGRIPLPPIAKVPGRPGTRSFDGVIAELPPSFADPGAAERWLERALRSVVEGLDADRAEIFTAVAGELRPERSWPPTASTSRLALERAGELPWIVGTLLAGSGVACGDLAALTAGAAADRAALEKANVRSFLAIPLRGAGQLVGVLSVTSADAEGWSDRVMGRVHAVGQAIGAILSFTSSQRALVEFRAESERLRERLESDAPRPKPTTRAHREIVGRSAAICRVLEKVEQVATTSASVLLLGETGTGKELVASAIHEMSERRGRPMVRVNCGALPASLVESELFGREKGAYTGALTRQAGRFEIAHNSTILLDEVGDLPPEVQVKLLRVLQQGEFERIGSTTTQRVNVRVIAATNRDLSKDVREGRFREDLFYRLNVFPIRIPALRERREDIPLLVWAFVDEFARSMGRPVERISRQTMESLQAYSWPGNVRELRNVIERAMILHRGATLHVDAPESEFATFPESRTLEDVERHHILSVLQSTEWRVRGKGGAAEILGLKPTTLESRMEKLGIRRPDSAPSVSDSAPSALDARGH